MSWATHSADIVIFGIIPWGPGWQRPQHFARQLIARGHRVVYVTPHVALDGETWRELTRAGAPEESEEWNLWASRLVRVQLAARRKDSIHSSAPWTDEDLAHAHHCFRRLAHDLRLRAPILLTQSPGWWPLLAYIRERGEFPLVYDCLDEHVGWNHEMSDRVRSWEQALAAAADLVLASAPRLRARLATIVPDVHLVPNGCDAAHFAAAARPNGVLESLRSGPIIGYYGAISAGWFDTALLVTLAETRPDWSFVCIGPADESVRVQLEGSPNVLLLGEVPYADLPRYCADFDVAIIPFLVNDLTAAVDPVKLYEYFAAEKPVVITPLPAAYGLQGLLAVAEDAPRFERAIARFLTDPGDGAARSTLATDASWDRRVDAFYPALLGCLPGLDVEITIDAWSPVTRRCIESVRRDRSYAANLILVDRTAGAGVPAYVQTLQAEGRAVVVPPGRAGDGATREAAARCGGRAERAGGGPGDYVVRVDGAVELPPGTLLGLVGLLMGAPDVRTVAARSDGLQIGRTRYRPRFADPEEMASFFDEQAWRHFGTEEEGPGSACPVAIFRRRDVSGREMAGDAASRESSAGAGAGRSIVAGGILVHGPAHDDATAVDPVVYRALTDRARRRPSVESNSCSTARTGTAISSG